MVSVSVSVSVLVSVSVSVWFEFRFRCRCRFVFVVGSVSVLVLLCVLFSEGRVRESINANLINSPQHGVPLCCQFCLLCFLQSANAI